jgi:hypothetical protein
MDNQSHNPAAPNDDKRELYTLVREDRERIASVEGAVESLASSMEGGFRNIGNRIDDLAQAQRSSRPQLGVIATIFISTAALLISLAGFALKSSLISLAGFALKSSTTPLAHDIRSLNERTSNIERRMEVRYSDADDRQDAEIRAIQKISDQFLSELIRHEMED